MALISPKFDELAKQFGKFYKSGFPKAKQGNIDRLTYVDMWMFGVFTLIFAAEEGKIYLPETPADGAALTLILVK